MTNGYNKGALRTNDFTEQGHLGGLGRGESLFAIACFFLVNKRELNEF